MSNPTTFPYPAYSPSATSARFFGKTAVVTGAARGIGRATALLLATQGARVWALDADALGVQALAEAHHAIRPYVLDVSDDAAVQRFVAVATDQGEAVHILVNNAAIPGEAALSDLTLEHWNAVLAVNTTAPMLLCKHLWPHFAPGGAVVNVSSVAASRGFAQRAAYCTSKAALLGLTRALAAEFLPLGVRVNALCPGTVDTPWIGRLIGQHPEPQGQRQRFEARQPMGRMGQAEEIAAAIAFLASDEASFMTGATLNVDGGLLALNQP